MKKIAEVDENNKYRLCIMTRSWLVPMRLPLVSVLSCSCRVEFHIISTTTIKIQKVSVSVITNRYYKLLLG